MNRVATISKGANSRTCDNKLNRALHTKLTNSHYDLTNKLTNVIHRVGQLEGSDTRMGPEYIAPLIANVSNNPVSIRFELSPFVHFIGKRCLSRIRNGPIFDISSSLWGENGIV